jgi:hypothetical protein
VFVYLLHFNDGRPSRRTRQQSTIYKVRRHVQHYGAAEPLLVVSRVCESHKNKPTAVQLAPASFLALISLPRGRGFLPVLSDSHIDLAMHV